MDDKKGFMGFRAEDIEKIISSPAAKELLRRLNENGGQAFEKAKKAAQGGDYETVRKLMEPMMKDEKTASLIETLKRKQG